MALTSLSTLDDALGQYNDNLAWDGNITKAQNALEAVRWILANRPRIIATNNRTVNFDSFSDEKKLLEAFINSTSTAVTAARCSFVRGKMLT